MQITTSQGFGKHERLSRKKEIQELFNRGSYFYFAPLRIKFIQVQDEAYHQVLVSVPKRLFRKAADRNLIKRRVRESYRRHKFMIEDLPVHHMAFIPGTVRRLDQQEIDRAMKGVLTHLRKVSNGSDS